MFESTLEAYVLAKNSLKSQDLKSYQKAKIDILKLYELKKLLKNAISRFK